MESSAASIALPIINLSETEATQSQLRYGHLKLLHPILNLLQFYVLSLSLAVILLIVPARPAR